MVSNFWSFDYIICRFKEKAEECGLELEEKSGYKKSSECQFCRSEGARRSIGLFYCGRCGMAMNADVVGALNMARNGGTITIIPSPIRGRDNGVVAK